MVVGDMVVNNRLLIMIIVIIMESSALVEKYNRNSNILNMMMMNNLNLKILRKGFLKEEGNYLFKVIQDKEDLLGNRLHYRLSKMT